MADHPPLKFAAIGLDHRHIYHQVGRLLELGAECKGYHARDSAVPLEGFVRALSRSAARAGRARAARGPRDPADRDRRDPVRAGRDRDRGDAARQGRDGRQAGRDHPGPARRRHAPAAGDRAHLVGQLLRALRGAGDDPRGGAGAGGRDRPGGADGRLRPAPAQPPPAPRLVLPAAPMPAASWSTSPRTRSTSSSSSPAPTMPRSWRARSPTTPIRISPSSRTSARSCCAASAATATSASTGTRPTACPPGATAAARSSAPRATSSCGNTSTSPGATAPTTCSWSTATATRHIDCSDAPLPYYARLIADVFERTETAMPQAHCFKVCELALEAQARAVRLA